MLPEGHGFIACPGVPLLNVERFSPGDLPRRVGGNLVAAGLGLPQQFLTAAFQGLAALVDGDRFLQRHLAVFQPLHDRLELLERALEAQLLGVRWGVFGHNVFQDAPRPWRGIKDSYAGVLWRDFTRPSMR